MPPAAFGGVIGWEGTGGRLQSGGYKRGSDTNSVFNQHNINFIGIAWVGFLVKIFGEVDES